MTIFINHRVNTISALAQTPTKYGVEIDLRSNHQDIILSHDPFCAESISFQEWIKHFNHELLILNVKEEGLEKYILQILDQASISNFFFLDQSFPFLIKTTKLGDSRSAVRYSEYESIKTVQNLAYQARWVWVDYFSKFPLSLDQYLLLKSMHYEICLVSPELQGFSHEVLQSLINILNSWDIAVDAVCTKRPDLWDKLYRS